MKTKVIIARCVKEYRKKNGLTQEAFGELVGVSGKAVSKWEREMCFPDMQLLPLIANTLSIGICDLFE